jgi:LPXTG-motif cell wall-anchored protein
VSDPAGRAPATQTDPEAGAGHTIGAPGESRAPRGAWSAAGRWGGVAELRADLLPAARVTAALALTGIPAGLLWWLLAPREDYRVLADGVQPLGDTSAELFAADDGVYVLIMAGLGLLAGIACWLLRRRRGVALLAGLTLGTGVSGVLAWQLGELLGEGPTQADLQDVGATVTTRLELMSLPALTVAPFVAVLVYVAATLLASRDDLGRRPSGDARRSA